MNSSTATEQYARGIYNAFAAYKKRHGGSITVPYMPEPVEEKAPAKKPDVKPEEPQTPVTEETIVTAGTQEPQMEAPQTTVAPMETHPTSVTPEFSEKPESPVETEPQKQPETPMVAPLVAPATSNAPIFKVQILVSSQKLKAGDKRLKGQTGVDSYVENGMTKYTVGASENYNEIYQLRKSLLDKFPEAFIIAFKNGQRMDVQQAIREFKNKRVK